MHIPLSPGPDLRQRLETPDDHPDLVSGNSQLLPSEEEVARGQKCQGTFADHAGEEWGVVERTDGEGEEADLGFDGSEDPCCVHVDELGRLRLGGDVPGAAGDVFDGAEAQVG